MADITFQIIDEHILNEMAVWNVIRTALGDDLEQPTRQVDMRLDSRKIYQVRFYDATQAEADAVVAALRAAFPYATTPIPGD
jgi:hypothetical protein